MKNISLLVWLSQLGLSVFVPLGGFIFLGVWLHKQFSWGIWIIVLCTLIGLICAVDGFRQSLKAMERLARDETREDAPVSFNEHE